MLIGLTVVNFSEKCRSHHKNYEWRLKRDFLLVHIFKLVRTITPRNFSSTRKIHPNARGDSEENFFNKKNEPQCKRGVVIDIVKYYYVSDNFILTCLLLFIFEDDIKLVRIST